MTAVAPASNAGKTLGIVGLILSFFSGPIGLIVSAVARSQSKKAGLKNGPATAGIVIGVLSTICLILAIVLPIVLVGSQCASLGSGEHVSDDGAVTITCP
jgi:hypothetical protein